jgi:uncharacterized membrane protein YfcA
MDITLVVVGLLVGVVVGLTGMGGGALMTPILVLLFNVPPLAAVSSDLVASFFMKPIGGLVHLRRGTVNLELVTWLCVGSVPAAFAGVLALRLVGDSQRVEEIITIALGAALLMSVGTLVYKSYLNMKDHAYRQAAGLPPRDDLGGPPRVHVRRVATVLVGVAGGLVVGMTSVGSGSLIIIALLALYPTLTAGSLVGTDLVQAVPLVGSAALAHIMFGDFQLDLTVALLIGAIPGVWLGARWSSVAPGGVIRRALALVLAASGLKLLGVPTVVLGVLILAFVIVGPLAWSSLRARHGLPFLGPGASRAVARVRGTSNDTQQAEPAGPVTSERETP